MSAITPIDGSAVIDIHPDLSITTRKRVPGPPRRIEGMSAGIVTMSDTEQPPHGGEVHPDGDELLYVISGRLRVVGDSMPEAALELGPGQGCIVGQGEWHTVEAIGRAEFLHITPGPNGDHRSA